jgi:hypothetical protein
MVSAGGPQLRGTHDQWLVKRLNPHYKTNSRIIRRIIRFGLVVEYHPDYQVNYQPDYRPGSAEVPAW